MARVKYFECRLYLKAGVCYAGVGMTKKAAEAEALRIASERLGKDGRKDKKLKLSDFEQHETLEWYGPKPRTLGEDR